ncbi:MAG: hypothetical protein K2Y14_09175 [Burkholderiales bacterium]|nr:hypothetical protein [Burkholderiales bacterium]
MADFNEQPPIISDDDVLKNIIINNNSELPLNGDTANQVNTAPINAVENIELERSKEAAEHTKQLHNIKRQKAAQKLENESQNKDLRAEFSRLNFKLVKVYLIVVAVLLFITGIFNVYQSNIFSCNISLDWHSLRCSIEQSKTIRAITPFLSDSVLITLLTTTTVNVIGIYLIVLHYLFKNDSKATTKD